MSLLTSSWLRRAAYPLRTSTPKLYMALNRVRGRMMTRGRDLAAYQSHAVDRFERRVGLRGKRVLEIGTDADAKVLRSLLSKGAAAVMGVNRNADMVRRAGQRIRNARLVVASVTELPLPDASIDAVFSIATFEHIHDLPRALAELHRVLRPNGIVYANFGPIWSSGKGHHLDVKVGAEEARHTLPDKNPLPDYCHLLMSPAELRDALRDRTLEVLREPIVRRVYDDPSINRLFFHEYLEAMHASRLRVESVVPERDPVAPQLLRILQFKYPKESAFDVTNAEIVLVRDA